MQSVTSDICNIRTMTGTCRYSPPKHMYSPPKHMEVQDYVSKKERLEKVHRAMVTGNTVI